jgi:hypothetical protein
MGIANPRPAMRCGEERRIKEALALHASLTKEIREAGASNEIASKIAFNIVTTRHLRRKLWRVS